MIFYPFKLQLYNSFLNFYKIFINDKSKNLSCNYQCDSLKIPLNKHHLLSYFQYLKIIAINKTPNQ